jgi:uncharacterized protein
VQPERVAELLGLEVLPEEGGLFRQTLDDGDSTAIYALLIAPEFSAMHRLVRTEVDHHYAGDPLRMLLLHPDGRIDQPVLGTDLAAGQRPQVIVPGGVWQGSSTAGAWTLFGCTMAPGFRWGEFELPSLPALLDGWPEAAERIRALVR